MYFKLYMPKKKKKKFVTIISMFAPILGDVEQDKICHLHEVVDNSELLPRGI